MATIPAPVARSASPADAELLVRFECSRGEWYEVEVERHIQRDALARASSRASHSDHRLLLFESDAHELMAVAAHEIGDLTSQAGEPIPNTHIDVIAVALRHRGKHIEGQPQRRLARFVLDTVIADAADRSRGRVTYAGVARENKSSLRLVAEVGLIGDLPHPDARYVNRVGVLG